MKAWNKGKKGWTNSGSFKKGHSVPKQWRENVGQATKQRIEANGLPWTGTHPKHLQRENHPKWIGGIIVSERGYVYVRKNRNYIRENRLVMQQHLGRQLTKEEVVHHINGNKKDNRIENLMLFENDIEHKKFEWQHQRRRAKWGH